MSETKFIPALGYDFLSDYYDLAIKVTMPEKKFRNRLIDFVDPKEKEKILEFGFGTAQNIIILKQRFPNCNIQGVDIDPKIKSIAEYKLKKTGIEANFFYMMEISYHLKAIHLTRFIVHLFFIS